jgi:AraC family transcriptional regulator
MQHEDKRDSCGNPYHERSLLASPAMQQWRGLPLGCIEVSPNEVHADLTAERTVLLMIDSGHAQVDFDYGLKPAAFNLGAGSIGFLSRGTHIKDSRWRWRQARRFVVDLESACVEDLSLTEHFRRAGRESEFEFRDEGLGAVVRSMVREAAAGSPNGQLFAQSLSLGVAMRLHERATGHLVSRRERGKLTASQARRLEELIQNRLGKELALATLAEEVGFSPAQFVRLFKNTMGCTPHQYVLRARVERARELVVAGSLPLAIIADETGFASQSHMTSAFVRAFDLPPGEMRRQSRLDGSPGF